MSPRVVQESRNPTTFLSAASDELLVQRAIDGDTLAFRALVDRYAPLMRAYVSRVVGSHADADDLVQNAFIVAWKHLPRLRDHSQVKSWLMQIASRNALSHLRTRRTFVEVPTTVVAAGNDPEAAAIQSAELRALDDALAALPVDQRQCWLLREVAGLSYQDIAESLSISAGQVRGKLARARVNITVRMEEWR